METICIALSRRADRRLYKPWHVQRNSGPDTSSALPVENKTRAYCGLESLLNDSAGTDVMQEKVDQSTSQQ